MQANKATPQVMNDLRQWLDNPKTGPGAAAEGARDDLKWVNNTKDLSSISLKPQSEKDSSIKQEKISADTGGGKNGFAALFNCGGKRK